MLNRTIDIKEYVPPYIMDYVEFKKVMEAENPELQAIESTHVQVIDNRYITTCDIDGIARFESILGITPLADDTLENRQFRVLSRWNASIPYNFQFLNDKLKTLCGDGYTILIDFDLQTIVVKLGLDNKNNFNSVIEILEQIVPCNMITNVILLFNTHDTLAAYTHDQLSVHTHDYLKEGNL